MRRKTTAHGCERPAGRRPILCGRFEQDGPARASAPDAVRGAWRPSARRLADHHLHWGPAVAGHDRVLLLDGPMNSDSIRARVGQVLVAEAAAR